MRGLLLVPLLPLALLTACATSHGPASERAAAAPASHSGGATAGAATDPQTGAAPAEADAATAADDAANRDSDAATAADDAATRDSGVTTAEDGAATPESGVTTAEDGAAAATASGTTSEADGAEADGAEPDGADHGLGEDAPHVADIVESRAEETPFETWLAALRDEARARGIDASVLDAALEGIAPHPRVIELDRHQPEVTLTFDEYRRRVLPAARIAQGRRLYQEHQGLLREVARAYGVQPRFIVALWGIETSYGRFTGGFNVIEALATLAWEGRRASFFRGQLLQALDILDAGDVSAGGMTGSWAGAMGQCQFMPSSYKSWAVDHDGDGRRDIWRTLPDVFGSTANYLSKQGWNPGETWGREVRLPKGFDARLVGRSVRKPLAEWSRLGVRRADGRPLPKADMAGALVQPGGAEGPTYLVYGNYEALLHWNKSLYFATAVGLLSDAIGGR